MPSTPSDDGPRSLEFLSSDQRRTFRSSEGTTTLWVPARNMMVSRVVGVLNVEPARVLAEELEQQARGEPKHLAFHDWEEMTNYDDAARAALTEVARKMRPNIECIHILLRSRIVAFGVRTANIIVKVIQVHTERPPFERALQEAIRTRRAHAGPR